MAFVIADHVKETSTTTGTGALTLAGAMTGFQTFAAKCAVGDTVYYGIQAVDGSGLPTGEWECGLGTYSAANTLTRTTVTSSSNSDVAVSFAAGTKQVFITLPAAQAAWARERLTADRTYYVRTDGNDNNSGLANTSGGAFLTIQKACNVAAGIDAALFQVTVQIADGTYTTGAVVAPMHGALPLVIRGNNTTPSNVHVNVTNTCFLVTQASAYVQVLDMKLSATTLGLSAAPFGFIEYGNVVFGTAGNRHVNAQYHGHTNAVSDYTISGGAQCHVMVANGATSRIVGRTVTITGTPAFSVAFASASDAGSLAIISNSFSGSATGPRYLAATNGVISAGGATLPGDTAGTTATGGQYA